MSGFHDATAGNRFVQQRGHIDAVQRVKLVDGNKQNVCVIQCYVKVWYTPNNIPYSYLIL